MFGNHGLCGLLEEGAHEKSPKCLGGNLGDFGEFCKGLDCVIMHSSRSVLIAVEYCRLFSEYLWKRVDSNDGCLNIEIFFLDLSNIFIIGDLIWIL